MTEKKIKVGFCVPKPPNPDHMCVKSERSFLCKVRLYANVDGHTGEIVSITSALLYTLLCLLFLIQRFNNRKTMGVL